LFEPQPAPAPSGLLVGLAAGALLVVSFLGTIVSEIAKRWRGVVIAHLFFLTLWMAIQVFFFATGAYWCLPGNNSTAEWFSKYFTHIPRCGSAAPHTLPASGGSTAAAAPAPAPVPAPVPAVPRPPATVPASPRVPAAPAQSAPPPAVGAPLAPPGSGPLANWSGRAVQNCWRNRSLENSDCYDGAYQRRTAETPPAAPPPVVRYYRYLDPPEPPPVRYPAPPYSCRGPYGCEADEYWLYDYNAP
jgi:hypothetical protein